jgi:hypothetical protein
MKTIEAGIHSDTNKPIVNKYRAIDYLCDFDQFTRVSDLYDNEPHFRTIFGTFIPNFEYPDWSHKRVCDIINYIEMTA